MSTDSWGVQSLGSDHHSISLFFGSRLPRAKGNTPAASPRALSDEALERVVALLEEEAPSVKIRNYDSLQFWIKQAMDGQRGASRSSRGRHHRRAWWDTEVAGALAHRKECCRQHRHALKRGAAEAEVDARWSLYLDAKKAMATMAQQKMGAVNRKLLQTIKEVGRDSGRKFWQHIKAQKANPDHPTLQLRDPETGAVFEGEDCLRLVEQRMALKLQSRTYCHERHRTEDPLATPPPSLGDSITQREPFALGEP
ncbi:hypothetical protein HPB50_027609 [Hyalomma asiaticum]|nr:hypothetical protein HPB50_027609 [Hyalomma asiaticum]